MSFAKFLKETKSHNFPFTDAISQAKYLYKLVLEFQDLLVTEFDCRVAVFPFKEQVISEFSYTLAVTDTNLKIKDFKIIAKYFGNPVHIEFMTSLRLTNTREYYVIVLDYNSPSTGVLSGYTDKVIPRNLGFTEGFEYFVYEISYLLKNSMV